MPHDDGDGPTTRTAQERERAERLRQQQLCAYRRLVSREERQRRALRRCAASDERNDRGATAPATDAVTVANDAGSPRKKRVSFVP
ncbi:hypothetical protein ABC855_g2087 [[Candida] zeylanoides]